MPAIDKNSPIPYYEQLAEFLRRTLGAREAKSGVVPLPSENELAEQYSINRATVRHALDVLEREGWIYREKGRGSFAATRRVEHELTQLVSTTEASRKRGWSLVTRVLMLRRKPAAPLVAQALELETGTPVYMLRRLRLVKNAPMAVQTAYLPAHLTPQLEDHDLSSSLYRLLETRYGLRLWTGRETLRARGATAAEAQWLRVKKGAPVMAAERLTYSSTGVAVEYLEAIWRGDRYDFKVTLTRPPD